MPVFFFFYCALFMCRYSVNVFRPPFQSGRTSPEVNLSRADHSPTTSSIAEGHGTEEEEIDLLEAGHDQEQDHVSSEVAAAAQASFHSAGDPNLQSTHTTDSGFSELLSSSQDPFGEKETSCEKAVKPEGNFIIRLTVNVFVHFIFGICCQLELTFVCLCVHTF